MIGVAVLASFSYWAFGGREKCSTTNFDFQNRSKEGEAPHAFGDLAAGFDVRLLSASKKINLTASMNEHVALANYLGHSSTSAVPRAKSEHAPGFDASEKDNFTAFTNKDLAQAKHPSEGGMSLASHVDGDLAAGFDVGLPASDEAAWPATNQSHGIPSALDEDGAQANQQGHNSVSPLRRGSWASGAPIEASQVQGTPIASDDDVAKANQQQLPSLSPVPDEKDVPRAHSNASEIQKKISDLVHGSFIHQAMAVKAHIEAHSDRSEWASYKRNEEMMDEPLVVTTSGTPSVFPLSASPHSVNRAQQRKARTSQTRSLTTETDVTSLPQEVNAMTGSSAANVSADSVNTEAGMLNIGNFGFCGHCANGGVLKVRKDAFLGGYPRLKIWIKDAKKMEMKEAIWEMKDFQGIGGKFYDICNKAREKTHNYKPGEDYEPSPEGNTEEIVDLLMACLKAPELCNGAVKDVHYVGHGGLLNKDVDDRCKADYKKAQERIDQKAKEEREARQAARRAKNFATAQSTPSLALVLTCLVSVTSMKQTLLY